MEVILNVRYGSNLPGDKVKVSKEEGELLIKAGYAVKAVAEKKGK